MSFLGENFDCSRINSHKRLFLDLPKDYQIGISRLPKNKKFKQKIG